MFYYSHENMLKKSFDFSAELIDRYILRKNFLCYVKEKNLLF